MEKLTLSNIGPIKQADLHFGDLTVLVGPQASGKSIALQWLKLVQDCGQIQEQLEKHGLDYGRKLPEFLDLYFGEGMRSIWRGEESLLKVDERTVDVSKLVGRKQKTKEESVFLIPAQRVIALSNGWPRPFASYGAGDPYCLRAYSEELRLLMEQREFAGGGPLFPKSNRLKAEYRDLLKGTVFAEFELKIDRASVQKRLVLGGGGSSLPFMVWSAGQREFVPLLLGLYWLMPPAKVAMRDRIQWVVLEELEMGLHPRAVAVVLLIVLELLTRGYRVCLSTHSPQVLELVWALEKLRDAKGTKDDFLEIFGAPKSAALRSMAEKALQKRSKVYYFDPKGSVTDITNLDPSSDSALEASWGGLLEFSARANKAVARAVANSERFQSGDLFVESGSR